MRTESVTWGHLHPSKIFRKDAEEMQKKEKETKKQKEKEDKPEAEEMRDAALLSLRRKFIRI